MKEIFTHEGSRDFRQRYLGSYGWFTKENGQKILVLMDSIDDGAAVFRDSSGFRYTALSNAGIEFEFLPATRRLFEHDSNLFCIERRPARQWQRGVAAANTKITCLTIDGLESNLSFAKLVAAFDDTPIDPKKKFKKWKDGLRTYCLLSNMFAIVDDCLYLYKDEIGKVDTTGKVVLYEPLFKQEVKDLEDSIKVGLYL